MTKSKDYWQEVISGQTHLWDKGRTLFVYIPDAAPVEFTLDIPGYDGELEGTFSYEGSFGCVLIGGYGNLLVRHLQGPQDFERRAELTVVETFFAPGAWTRLEARDYE